MDSNRSNLYGVLVIQKSMFQEWYGALDVKLNIAQFYQATRDFLCSDEKYDMDLNILFYSNPYVVWDCVLCEKYFKSKEKEVDLPKDYAPIYVSEKERIQMCNVINILTCIAYGRLSKHERPAYLLDYEFNNMTVRDLLSLEPNLFDFLLIYTSESEVVLNKDLISKSKEYEVLFLKEKERLSNLR